MTEDPVTIDRSALHRLVELAELTEDTSPAEAAAVAHARQVLADAELLYDAWAIIANAANWAEPDSVWVAAATKWRDRWHATLPRSIRHEVESAIP